MFHTFLIVLLIIGTLGVATYGGVLLLQATQDLSDTQGNLRRMEMVAWNLRNSGGAYSPTHGYAGRLLASSYAGYSVPDPAIFAHPSTLKGINFHYCPYTPLTIAGTNMAIATPDGSADYIAQYNNLGDSTLGQKLTTRTRDAGNSNNITADGDAPSGALHIVTSPAMGKASAPLCNALITANDTATVLGGSVAAVTLRQAFNSHVYNAAKIMTLYAAPASSGDGTGRDANNAMTLDDAMTTWRAVQPRILIVNLVAGSYAADGTNTFPAVTGLGNGNPAGMKLVWRGAGSGATEIGVTGTVTISLPVDFQVEALSFGSVDTTLIAEKGGNLLVDGAALTLKKLFLKSGSLTIVGNASSVTAVNTMAINPKSELILAAPLTYTSSSDAIAMALYGGAIKGGGNTANGTLAVYAPNGGTGIQIVSGAVNSVRAIDIHASSGVLARGVLVMPGGELAARGAVTVHDTPSVAAIDAAGVLTLDNAALLVPEGGAVGVRLVSGGRFYMNGAAVIGSSGNAAERPTTGVYDAGGNKVGGGDGVNAHVYAVAACWGGAVTPNLFSDSAEGMGQASLALGTVAPADYRFLLMDNRSNWLCTR